MEFERSNWRLMTEVKELKEVVNGYTEEERNNDSVIKSVNRFGVFDLRKPIIWVPWKKQSNGCHLAGNRKLDEFCRDISYNKVKRNVFNNRLLTVSQSKDFRNRIDEISCGNQIERIVFSLRNINTFKRCSRSNCHFRTNKREKNNIAKKIC